MEITGDQLTKLTSILQKYKAGKARTEQRIIASESWWKLRNGWQEMKITEIGADGGYRATSGWLHNVLVAKHADAMEAYPEPIILPREAGDKPEAQILSAIVPLILEQADFEDTYSAETWQKLKTGTGVFKVVWDKAKLNGLGDIAIRNVNLLNLFWEPGITDIQDSRYLFHVELVDKDLLEQQYPDIKSHLAQTMTVSKFQYDDTVDTSEKATVIECYYKVQGETGTTLQYIKYVNDYVLYATETDGEYRERGLYDHGLYPFVFDTLFPIEGSPCGYGYVDLCKNPQTMIDLLNTAFLKNAMVGATPRYFARSDGAINEQEFLDTNKAIVHVSGNLGDDTVKKIDHNGLDGNYVSMLDRIIQELRETSGNTESANGATPSGVTAASAIAALQEAAGKGSRDATRSAYRAYREVVRLCIELIRQFYDVPRQFRIVGEQGMQQFVQYSNAGIKPQPQGVVMGEDMGYRLPVFDIKVEAAVKTAYTKVAQNELALQLLQLGFFNPQNTDQTLMCLDMMDFDGKDDVSSKIAQNGTIYDRLIQYMQLALTLAAKYQPDMVQGLAQDIQMTMGGGSVPVSATPPEMSAEANAEPTRMQNARARSREASQPDESARAVASE